MAAEFKKGDKVQRINGGVFPNGHNFLTVNSVTKGILFTEVWFKETESSIPNFSLEHFTKYTSHYKDDNMTTIFRQGDKVQRIDGDYFSNGYKVVTVDNITSDSNGSYDKVWLKETESRLPSHALELATKTSQFEKGDKVRRKDGGYFSDDYKVVTVDFVTSERSYDVIWFKETGSNLQDTVLELATDTSHYSEVIDELEYERSQLLDKAGKISQVIITLKELDSNE